ncbi:MULTISPECIES: hypothetical protein [unclassified Serratia (in: enterobacteria)]|uniref:hypothetical protein n=1 Tax=unclassified Serratia (in: enterobacteria) TaxID=2647522 RepID=UPI002ED654A8|nr:hypothetical protein [Serratia sp. C2(2)]MEE4447031.1 hypothetical protein [Serratia sp. C2(1)]
MEKGILVIFLFLLLPWSHPAVAARYDREQEEVSPVLFSKKLKEMAHGLWDEMDHEKPRPPVSTQSENTTLALRKGCQTQGKAASATGEPHPSALPREEHPLLIDDC